jgi:CNT family concentrative nucleoside transporter
MSAPAALAISKIAFPETEESPTAMGKKGAYDIPASDDANVVHAATNGAVIGTQLMLNIAGNLIAFLAIIAMLDALLTYLGDKVDITLSFNICCEYLFYPVAWLMGVDPDDCDEVAIVIGLKIFANEFVAYEKLAFTYREVISDRSYYIASYALCGFSNFGSIGVQLGGLTPLAPNQGPKLAKLVFSAMVAGNTACFVTACIAGIFYEGG